MFRILVDFGCETVRGNRLTAGSIVHNLCLVATSRLQRRNALPVVKSREKTRICRRFIVPKQPNCENGQLFSAIGIGGLNGSHYNFPGIDLELQRSLMWR